jgi:sulfur relay (sulfurtransferase) DsrF/TusC family protein
MMNTVAKGASETNEGASAAMAIAPFPSFTAQGLDRLRRMYAAMPPSREALQALFAVQAAQTAPSEEWTAFFIETASAQLIWDERPTGVLTEADARWLLERFDDAPSMEVLGLLARVLEEAHQVPRSFPAEVRERAALFRLPRASDLAAARQQTPYLRLVV